MQTPAGTLTVVDGDTLRLPDGRRVRLPAVDTPETGRPDSAEAAAFTAHWLAGRGFRLVPPDPPRDHYGRFIADVVAEGDSLSAALVGAGLAWVYDNDDPQLIALQAQAVQRRLGVHAHLERAGSGPFVLSRTRFHRADCRWVAADAARRALSSDVAALLARGLAPCRTCLPWPP